MTEYIILAFAAMFILLCWAAYDYFHKVVKPVNKEIKSGQYLAGIERIKYKLSKARTYEDCRQITSNLLHLDMRYATKIPDHIFTPASAELWGLLDAKARRCIENDKDRIKRQHYTVEIGTMTIADLLST